MTTRLGSVLSPPDLPLAELSSARLDGELFALGECWCPVDEIDGPDNRARVARRLVPSRAIAERLTAAWIYGLAVEPARHQFCTHLGARAHVQPSSRLRLREVDCSAEDTRNIAGLTVTRPLRTAVDLARLLDEDADDPVPLLAALLRLDGHTDVRAAGAACRGSRLPHTARARERFDRVQAAFDAEPIRACT